VKKKKTRRSSYKYPALRKDLNTKTRHYYIEPDYIDGVTNSNGEQVIRPLTAREKQWLNKFYEEYIVASFKNTSRDLHNKQAQRRALYRDNNHRFWCLYNTKQRTGDLVNFSTDNYDKMQYETLNHVDFELLYINEIEMRDFAREILRLSENLEPLALANFVQKEYTEYFNKMFSEEELKKMKPKIVGETLIEEAKVFLSSLEMNKAGPRRK
jgi:hypothetical protein